MASPGQCLIVAVLACAAVRAEAATSTWVWRGADGRLSYRAQADGDRIADFSMVGYGAGWVDLPAAPPATVTVSATTGDATARIQAALSTVAALPLQSSGYRGTVLLGPGDYEIAGQVKITASGIVLRGSGRDLASGSATRLIATGTSTRDVIAIGSTTASPNYSGFSKIAIADARVPVGATSFTVASTAGLAVGHTINVNWSSNQAWINANNMNLLDNPWQPGDRQQNSDRVITRIEGSRVFVDAPITSAIDTAYGGGTIQRYNGFTSGGRITNVGVENLVGQSLAVRDELNEARAWSFVGVSAAENVFIREIEARYFPYAATTVHDDGKFVTTSDARSLLPSGTITGSRRYTYNVDGQLTLVIDSTASEGRHDFVTGSNVTGPSAFVSGTATSAKSDVGTHHRWATGILFDTISVSGNAINIRDRGNMGTGHGWAGANSVVWNSKANSFIVQNPPTASNWLIGSVGTLVTEGGKVGTYDSLGARVTLGDTATNPTDSLYRSQLAERRATGVDLRFWVGDQGTAWTSGTGGWTNWSRTLGTRTNVSAPSARTDVIFNLTGTTALTTRPGVSTTVASVQFEAPTAPVTLWVGGTSGVLTLGGNGLTVFSGSHTITGDAGGSGAAGDVLLGESQAWEVRGTSHLVANARLGPATSVGTLEKLGSGTLTLAADSGGGNAFKATWSLAEGTTRVTHAAALGWSYNAVTVASGAALQLVGVGGGNTNGTLTLRGLGTSGTTGALRSVSGTNVLSAGAGRIVLDSGSTAIGVDAGVLTIERTISGTGGLVKSGSGRLVLAGTSTYTRGTTVLAGTLEARSAAALSSGTSAGNLTVTGGTLTLPAAASETLAVSLLSVDQAKAARIDLGAGRIDIAAGGVSSAALKADVLAGRGAGLWTGTSGITSAAVAVAGTGRAVGWYAAGDGSFRVGFAASGDTDLDGLVDILDAANFVAGGRYDAGIAADWQDGDFTYDGLLDILDAAEFLGTGLYDAGGYLPSPGPPMAAVPEPATAAWVVGAAVAASLLSRRRGGRRVPRTAVRAARATCAGARPAK
ncbi:MAG: beta strand repeat-containing protein [Planctomycetaceae bacterium]